MIFQDIDETNDEFLIRLAGEVGRIEDQVMVNTYNSIDTITGRDGIFILDDRNIGNGIIITSPDLPLIHSLMERVHELEKSNRLLAQYIYDKPQGETI